MTRILIVGGTPGELWDELHYYNPTASQITRTAMSFTKDGTAYHLLTPSQQTALYGWTWDRIDVIGTAKEHPQYEEFMTVATSGLASSKPVDLHPTGLRWNTIDTARHKAAIEVAEAYRAIITNEGPSDQQVNRLVNAADAWEKVR